MKSLERRLVVATLTIAILALSVMGWSKEAIPSASASGRGSIPCCSNLAYYGADFGGMKIATGIDSNSPFTRPINAPWPQLTDNYCFVAVVQGLTNFVDWHSGLGIPYPTQYDQGASDGISEHAASGTILHDMNAYMIPNQSGVSGSLNVYNPYTKNRKPFTNANTSYDYGGDPRAVAYASWYETPSNPVHMYHQYIYHTSAARALQGMSYTLDTYNEPVIASVDHGLHFVLVAGVWSYGHPVTYFPNTTIDSVAVYNPWDQNMGSYLWGAYFTKVTYTDWTSAIDNNNHTWWGKPYDNNGGSDPDPSIGIYAGAPHWYGNYVTIERDNNTSSNANYSFNEAGQLMTGP